MRSGILEQIGRLLLTIVVMFTFINQGCEGEPGTIETPQGECDCRCFGDYYIKNDWSVPQSYTCNSGGSFEVTLEAVVDTCFKGLSVLWFELEDDFGKKYRSNSVVFNANNAGTKDLVFGGSIPTGSYWAIGRLVDYNEDDPDSICADITQELQQIEITECPPPQKTMDIEYSYKESDTTALYSYDLFLLQNLAENMNISFNAANTTYYIFWESSDLDAALVNLNVDSVKEYIYVNKASMEMFLCGIKGFKNNSGVFLDWLGGKTIHNTDTFKPTANSGSLVSALACLHAATYYAAYKYEGFINMFTIHELGHQRAINGHCDSADFCVMNQYPLDHNGIIISRLWNPHFCPTCIDKIEIIEWK